MWKITLIDTLLEEKATKNYAGLYLWGSMRHLSIKYQCMFSSVLNTAVIGATKMCELIRTCVLIQFTSSETT